jgi:peptidoglycan/xylan/chitin deacetylase (PgdA/CDA1 family)
MNRANLFALAAIPGIAIALGACASVKSEKPQAAPEDAVIEWAPSGLPYPPTQNVSVPSGAKCDLKVLNWAGFEGAASYSFDDGQPSQVANWKQLKATGVPMTFYLNPVNNWVSGFDDTWKDALASRCELGNHTNTHKQLSEYKGDNALADDVNTCATYLTDRLGQKAPCSFAYPFGDTGWKKAFNGQFLLARSVYSGTIQPLDGTDPLSLPIYPVQAGDDAAVFNSVLDRSVLAKSWVIFMYHSILPGDNWYAGVQTADVVASLKRAKAGHKLWLDTVENVGTYWLAQKILHEIKPEGDDTAKTWKWSLSERFPAGKYLRVTVGGGTLSQGGKDLAWDSHGYYEIALDQGELSWRK